jgi:hypothetical protein
MRIAGKKKRGMGCWFIPLNAQVLTTVIPAFEMFARVA